MPSVEQQQQRQFYSIDERKLGGGGHYGVRLVADPSGG